GEGALARRLGSVPEPERTAAALDFVRSEVAAVLGHAGAAAVEPDAPFQDLGFDSLGAVELRNRLAHASGLRLPATLVFDHPTPAAVAEHIARNVSGEGAAGADGTAEEAEVRAILASIPLGRLRPTGL